MSNARQLYSPAPQTIAQVPARSNVLILDHGLPLLVYTVLAVVLTWPLAAHLGDALPAAPGEGTQDLWHHIWNLWWAGEALRRGVGLFYTDMLFYPHGATLLFHPLNLTSGLLSLPIQHWLGLVTAYNTLALLSFVLSGYAVFLLARDHGCGRAAALAGGLAYSASAYHTYHLSLGHLEQIALQWLPLYALALDALLRPTDDRRPQALYGGPSVAASTTDDRRPTTDHAVSPLHPFTPSPLHSLVRVLLATLALLAVIFTSLYMALYAALLTGLWVAWAIVGSLLFSPTAIEAGKQHLPSPAAREGPGVRFLRLGAMGLLTLAVVGPALLLPMARETQTDTYMLPGAEATTRGAALPADVLLPPTAHPVRAVLSLPPPYSPGAFLGYLVFVLAITGVIARPRVAGRWAVLALLAWLCSLGPALPFYTLISHLPLIQSARYPDHFEILTALAVAIPAAIGAGALLDRLRGWVGSAAAVALLGLMLLDLYPGPIPLVAPPDNPFYHTLARDTGQFSVLELPITRNNSAWLAMYAQTVHGHPILDGALARQVPHVPFQGLALMRELDRPNTDSDIIFEPPAARVAALRYFGLHYIIYHHDDGDNRAPPPTAEALSRVTGVPVTETYMDTQLVAYRLDLPDGPAALAAVATVGMGWYDLEASGPDHHRWLEQGGGSIQLYAPQDGALTLRLKLAAYRQPQRLDIYLDDQRIGQFEAQPQLAEVHTPPFQLGAGQHILRLIPSGPGISPRSAGEGNDDRPLTVGVFELEIGD